MLHRSRSSRGSALLGDAQRGRARTFGAASRAGLPFRFGETGKKIGDLYVEGFAHRVKPASCDTIQALFAFSKLFGLSRQATRQGALGSCRFRADPHATCFLRRCRQNWLSVARSSMQSPKKRRHSRAILALQRRTSGRPVLTLRALNDAGVDEGDAVAIAPDGIAWDATVAGGDAKPFGGRA